MNPATPHGQDRSGSLFALRADFSRYMKAASADRAGPRAWLSVLGNFGFLAGAVYRYGRWTRGIRPRIASLPFKLVYHLLHLLVQVLFGIRISAGSKIGPGLYIGHFSGIIVNGELGTGCSLGQGVTIGSKGAGRSNGYPVLGDRVYLGAGSMVIGSVRVGDDVVVGANTVVVEDVPDGHRVVSAPARILAPRRSEVRPRTPTPPADCAPPGGLAGHPAPDPASLEARRQRQHDALPSTTDAAVATRVSGSRR